MESERRPERNVDEAKLIREIRQEMEGTWRRELEQKVSSEEARMKQLQVAWRRQWEDMESGEKERQTQWEDRKKKDKVKKEQLEGLWRRQ